MGMLGDVANKHSRWLKKGTGEKEWLEKLENSIKMDTEALKYFRIIEQMKSKESFDIANKQDSRLLDDFRIESEAIIYASEAVARSTMFNLDALIECVDSGKQAQVKILLLRKDGKIPTNVADSLITQIAQIQNHALKKLTEMRDRLEEYHRIISEL